MNPKYSSVVVAMVFGVLLCGCKSDSAKTEAAEKKAFLGGPMPKGFMEKMNSAQNAGQKAAQDAAAKAAAKNGGN